MAYDILKKKQTSRDWSCGAPSVEEADSTSDLPSWFKRFSFTVGVLGGAVAGFFAGYQFGAGAIEKRHYITQTQHLRSKRKH